MDDDKWGNTIDALMIVVFLTCISLAIYIGAK
jgi:hypothetical protein